MFLHISFASSLTIEHFDRDTGKHIEMGQNTRERSQDNILRRKMTKTHMIRHDIRIIFK